MWRRADLAWTDVSEERIASIFRVEYRRMCRWVTSSYWRNTNYVRFEVFSAVSIYNSNLWHVAPHIARVNRCFGGPYRLHLLGINLRLYVPPKRRFTQDQHGATSQKTAFFIVTAVKTSNLQLYANPACSAICCGHTGQCKGLLDMCSHLPKVITGNAYLN
jgi:hypothetical protein